MLEPNEISSEINRLLLSMGADVNKEVMTVPPVIDGEKKPDGKPPEKGILTEERVAEIVGRIVGDTLKGVVKPDAPVEKLPEPEVDFLKDLDLNKVLTDKAALGDLLKSVYSKAVEDSKPTVDISEEVSRRVRLANSSNKFYDDNPDLVENSEFVAHMGNKLTVAHPDWDLPKVFAELATVVRTQLGKPVKPVHSFTPPGSGVRPVKREGAVGTQAEIKEMLVSIGKSRR